MGKIAPPSIPPLNIRNGTSAQPINEIASAFLYLFCSSTNYPEDDETLEQYITPSITKWHPNPVNEDFTMVELERAMKRLKSKAVGQDRVHNDMLKNLSPKNRIHLLHLFNSLYANSFVPDSWKIAIIIPLLKPGKPANEASSYRPISLTFCLRKLFERLVTNRLRWVCGGEINRGARTSRIQDSPQYHRWRNKTRSRH